MKNVFFKIFLIALSAVFVLTALSGCKEMTDPITYEVEYININFKEFIFTEIDSHVQMYAIAYPSNCQLGAFVWSSSDESVVRIDDSKKAYPGGEGKADIIVTTADGKVSAKCAVTVDFSYTGDVWKDISSKEDQELSDLIKDTRNNMKCDEAGYMINDSLDQYKSMRYPDVVAWLSVPGTNINFAVMQQSASKTYYDSDGKETNDYYLTHRYDNLYYKWGSAYLKQSTIASTGSIDNQNTTIFGHSGGARVFDQLEDVTRTPSWFDVESNRYIYLNTYNEDTVWQIFACYYVNITENEDVIRSDWTLPEDVVNEKLDLLSSAETNKLLADATAWKEFIRDDKAFAEYMNDWHSRAMIDFSDKKAGFAFDTALDLLQRDYGTDDITEEDKVLTLSAFIDGHDSIRYVVCAKLIKSRSRSER